MLGFLHYSGSVAGQVFVGPTLSAALNTEVLAQRVTVQQSASIDTVSVTVNSSGTLTASITPNTNEVINSCLP